MVKFHLSNLDELIQKVRNAHPKNYLNEAVVSYRAGAYRAALITTWIAVCVDIIEKVKELSASGDGAAKTIEDRLNGINPSDPSSMLAFERDILDIACDNLEFISVIEKTHLERLKEDRNICAHPTFSQDGSQFSPLAETALSYIVQSANYLLIHPPVKGKVVIKRLYELINEESFPADDEKAFVVLSSDNNLGRVRDSSVRNLVIVLLKRLFRDEDGLSLDLLARISSSLGAISRIYPQVYNEVLKSKLSAILSDASDKQLKRVFPFLARRQEEWFQIEKAVRIRIEGLLPSMSVDDLINYKLSSLSERISEINNVFQTEVNNLNNQDKVKLLSAAPSPILKTQAIELFVNSLSFDSAENRGINIILPLGKHFTSREVQDILNGACENTGGHGYNQILHAGGIEAFFVQFYSATKEVDENHEENWKSFHNRIKEKDVSYNGLDELMQTDGFIESIEEADEAIMAPDDIPF